jgi:hypothetical protein
VWNKLKSLKLEMTRKEGSFWTLSTAFIYYKVRFLGKHKHLSFCNIHRVHIHERGLISVWLSKENNKLRDWKNVFTLHIPSWAPHTYDFVVLTSLTHPRKILLVVLQIGKAKDLSAPLCMWKVVCSEHDGHILNTNIVQGESACMRSSSDHNLTTKHSSVTLINNSHKTKTKSQSSTK